LAMSTSTPDFARQLPSWRNPSMQGPLFWLFELTSVAKVRASKYVI